jgi:hypothetical protein
MAEIENLFAFDFDDTLAITPSIIGVQRINATGVADPGFREWIMENNLDIHDIENPDSDRELIWFSSGDFAKYEKSHKADLEYLESNSLEDRYDFTKTASIDVGGSSPVAPILDILKQASQDSGSRVVIITARSGTEPMQGLSSSSVITPTNQQDIQDFLSLQGVDLGAGNITTAGDLGPGPSAKVKAMEAYIDMYNPKNILFYDDNQGNVEAIAEMCEEYFPGINIKTFKVSKDGNVSFHGGCE